MHFPLNPKIPVLGAAQVRDLYWTFRNFRNRVADFLRYRRVTANMDERFPDATPEVHDYLCCNMLCMLIEEPEALPSGLLWQSNFIGCL